MTQEGIVFALLFFILGSGISLSHMVHKQRIYLRVLDVKLDALLKAQGVEWPLLSPEVQSLILDGRKIAAIKVHREEHPDMGLAEAKVDVEAFLQKSLKHPIG